MEFRPWFCLAGLVAQRYPAIEVSRQTADREPLSQRKY